MNREVPIPLRPLSAGFHRLGVGKTFNTAAREAKKEFIEDRVNRSLNGSTLDGSNSLGRRNPVAHAGDNDAAAAHSRSNNVQQQQSRNHSPKVSSHSNHGDNNLSNLRANQRNLSPKVVQSNNSNQNVSNNSLHAHSSSPIVGKTRVKSRNAHLSPH